MSSPTSSQVTNRESSLSAALQQAFVALSRYDRGSGRAALLPIDDAVCQSKNDERLRKELEGRLIGVLTSGSEVAKDYACTKLATIGTEASIPGLTALLADARLATSARTALEAVPSEKASKALRDRIPKLVGAAKVGAIISLGARRDAGSTRLLVSNLRSEDLQVQSAAAAALGEIASARAAKALRAFLPKVPGVIRAPVADSCLMCAERLSAANHKADAAALYAAVAAGSFPKHIISASKRGLTGCAAAVKT